MSWAVTGASGFLGRYVCSELIRRKIDFQPFHFQNPLSIAGLAHPSKPIDLAKSTDILKTQIGTPKALLHLAWSGLPNYHNPNHLIIELEKQLSFLKAVIHSGVQVLFVAGTCFEYGMQQGELTEQSPLLASNPYGQAKVQLLERLLELQETYDFKLVWGRLFYLYGDGQSEKSLWSQFQSAVRQKKSTFDMSGGQQVRDFLSVEKVARLIVDLTLKDRDLGAVNICSGKPITVQDLVQSWALSAGWSGRLNLGVYSYPDYEPMEFWGSRVKLQSILKIN